MEDVLLRAILTVLILSIVREHPEGITAEHFCAELEKRGFPSTEPNEVGLSPGQMIRPGQAIRILH